MRLNQEKKFLSSAEKFRPVFTYIKLSIKFIYTFFTRRVFFLRSLIFILVISWIFSGWPQIGNFPPKIQIAEAAIAAVSATPAGDVNTTAGTTCLNVATAGFGTSTTHTIVIVISTATARDSTISVSDNATGGTNSYTKITSENSSGGYDYLFYSANIPRVNASGLIVTASWTTSARNSCAFKAYTGVVSAAAATTSTGTSASTTTPTIATVTVSPNSWIVSGFSSAIGTGGTTVSARVGYGTLDASAVSSGNTTPSTGLVSQTTATQGATVTNGLTWGTARTSGQTALELRSDLINPTIIPNGGAISNDTSTTLQGSDAGVTYCYTTDGSTTPAAASPPTCSAGSTYISAFNMPAAGSGTTSVKVLATKTGWTNSTVVTSSNFVATAATPAYNYDTATYNNDTNVTITSTTASAVIKYCTDTNNTCDPTTGTTYSTPVPITATGTYLRSIATKTYYVNSSVKSALYTLQVANPSFGTDGGSYNNDTTSTQTSTTTGAVFCQTVDGATSPEASTPGICSVGTTGANATVIATGKTIKALGTKTNYVNSAVQTSDAFTLTVGAITSIPGPATYGSTQSVSLNIATTSSAVAHYTTNGNPVTCASTTYSGAFDVSVTTTVKAIGCKTNYVDDAAISDLYTISRSTAIEVKAQDYSTAVTSITFPAGAPSAEVSLPTNSALDTQTFGGAGTAKPVVTLYNGGGSTLTIWYNITSFTNSVVSSEYYLINTKGAACADASCITNAVTFDADTGSAGATTIAAGAEKDLYLKITLGSPWGKTGTSTLTILGEL